MTLALAEVFSFEALWQAVRRTARGKRGSPGVAIFRLELEPRLLFDDDRARLEALGHRLEAACFDLRLRLHRWCVMPTAPGVGFVGDRLLPRIVRVKRSSVGRAERRLRGMLRHDGDPRRVMASLRSSMAHQAHADGWRLTERVLRRLGLLYIPGPVR